MAASALIIFATVGGRVLVISRPIADPQAIVSLASHEWERLPAAAEAAARFPAAQVWITQPPTVTIYNCHDCANRVRRLGAAGVAESRVKTLRLTLDGTHGEAEACREVALAAGLTRLLVITSPYHTRRTLGVFRRAFSDTNIEVGVEPASRYSQARPALWWAAAYDRWYVAYEWAALAYYALRYQTWPVTVA